MRLNLSPPFQKNVLSTAEELCIFLLAAFYATFERVRLKADMEYDFWKRERNTVIKRWAEKENKLRIILKVTRARTSWSGVANLQWKRKWTGAPLVFFSRFYWLFFDSTNELKRNTQSRGQQFFKSKKMMINIEQSVLLMMALNAETSQNTGFLTDQSTSIGPEFITNVLLCCLKNFNATKSEFLIVRC